MVLALMLIAPLSAPMMVFAQDTPPSQVPASQQASIDFGCGVTEPKACIPAAAWGVMNVMGRLASLTGLALNYSMQKLVVQMGLLVNRMTAIDIAWKTMRDLVNVLLVFLTIFIGIATIIGISGYGYKQLLWKVILAALFVNFSITFTKFVIDVSNLFAIETYKQILVQGQREGAGGSDPSLCTNPAGSVDPANPAAPNPTDPGIPDDCMQKGIAGTFFHQTKLVTLYSGANLGASITEVDKNNNYARLFWTALLGSVFLLILAFVFGAAAFFIMMRLVILIMLIILSPIGLVAWITGVSGIGRQWWHQLLNQSFFLPIMIIFWWISLKIIMDMNRVLGLDASGFVGTAKVISGGTEAESASNFEGAMAIVVFYFIISAFLIASLVVARSLGAYGANATMSIGKSWSRKAGMMVGAGAGAATVGASAWALRKGIGGNAERIANSETLKKGVNSKNFFVRNAARGARKVSQGTAESSFDARAMMGKDAQKWMGAPKKGGFIADRKERDKYLKEEAEWTGKAKATSEEVRQRDKKINEIEEKYDGIKNTDVYAKAEQERLNEQDRVANLSASIEATRSDTTLDDDSRSKKIAELETELHTAQKKVGRLDTLKTNMDQQRTLGLEVKTGRTVGADGKERLLTADEQKERKAALANYNNAVNADMDLVDENVADLDEKIRKGGSKEMLDAWKKERETITKFHQKNREFADLSGRVSVEEEQAMAIALQQATDEVNKLKASESRAVDDNLSKTVKARGDARKDTYINVQSTRIEGLTEAPNDRDRAYLMTLRQPQGKDKQYADMEKLFEEWEKNKNSTASAPAVEASTTSTPPTA